MGSGRRGRRHGTVPKSNLQKITENSSKQYTILNDKVQELLVVKKQKCKEGGTYRSGRKKFLGEDKLDQGPEGCRGFIQTDL